MQYLVLGFVLMGLTVAITGCVMGLLIAITFSDMELNIPTDENGFLEDNDEDYVDASEQHF